jgi:hypothetical protein
MEKDDSIEGHIEGKEKEQTIERIENCMLGVGEKRMA